jgi:hypothetical protein
LRRRAFRHDSEEVQAVTDSSSSTERRGRRRRRKKGRKDLKVSARCDKRRRREFPGRKKLTKIMQTANLKYSIINTLPGYVLGHFKQDQTGKTARKRKVFSGLIALGKMHYQSFSVNG